MEKVRGEFYWSEIAATPKTRKNMGCTLFAWECAHTIQRSACPSCKSCISYLVPRRRWFGGGGADRGGMQPLVYRRSVGFGVPSSRAPRMQVLYLRAATQGEKDHDPKGLLQINFCRDAFQPYLTAIPFGKPDGFYIYTRIPTPRLSNYLPCKS